MDEEKKKFLVNAIKDSSFEDRFFNFKIETDFQLILSQLDFFKTISSIVIALLSVGYIFNQNLLEKLSGDFLLVSTILALATLFWTISFIREGIDFHAAQNNETERKLTADINEYRIKADEALKSDDWDSFVEYLKNKSKTKFPESMPTYQGEIFVFLLYLSISFLILGFFAKKCQFTILSWQTLLVTIAVFLLSFIDWSMKLINSTSKVFENLKNYLK